MLKCTLDFNTQFECLHLPIVLLISFIIRNFHVDKSRERFFSSFRMVRLLATFRIILFFVDFTKNISFSWGNLLILHMDSMKVSQYHCSLLLMGRHTNGSVTKLCMSFAFDTTKESVPGLNSYDVYSHNIIE